MLFINYKGNTPQQRFYNIGIKGNSKADKVGFVLPRQQGDLDLDGLVCNLKIENKETGFKDLINLNENVGYDEDTDSLMFGWEMTAKDTQHRTLDLQLEFLNGEEEIIFQTMIATIELGETIVVGETLPEKELSIIKQMELKIKELEQNPQPYRHHLVVKDDEGTTIMFDLVNYNSNKITNVFDLKGYIEKNNNPQYKAFAIVQDEHEGDVDLFAWDYVGGGFAVRFITQIVDDVVEKL